MRIAGIVCLGLALVIVLLTFSISYEATQADSRSTNDLRKTREILALTASVLSLVRDAETGQRGFLLTGDSSYLEPFRRAMGALDAQLGPLELATEGLPAQHTHAKLLRAAAQQKLSELKETVELRETKGYQAALAVVRTNRGRDEMASIFDIGYQITQEVTANFAFTTQASADRRLQTRWWIVTGSAVLFGLLLAAAISITRSSIRREQLIRALRTSEQRTVEVRDMLHTILSSIGDGVIAGNAHGKVTFLNPEAQRITGRDEDALGEPLEVVSGREQYFECCFP